MVYINAINIQKEGNKMTKNEQIASIMLEAAELLKNNDSYDNDYYTLYSIYNECAEINRLCESTLSIINHYSEYGVLTEGAALDKIKATWEKLIKWFKEKFKQFSDWLNKFKNKKGEKPVAKEDGEVVDPAKASVILNALSKQMYGGTVEEVTQKIRDLHEKVLDDAFMRSVKKGSPMLDYTSLRHNMEQFADRLEKEKDEEKIKNATEALKVVNLMLGKMTKSSQLYLPKGNENNDAEHTSNKSKFKYITMKKRPTNTFYYDSFKPKTFKPKTFKFDTFEPDTFEYSNIKPSYERKKSKTRKGYKLHEAIDFLYNQAVLCEDTEVASDYIEKAQALESLLDESVI